MQTIKWDRKNEITLKIAVNSFNKKIAELEKLEEKAILPEKITIEKAKETIKTERGLKEFVKSTRSFTKNKEMQSIKELETGEKITNFEYKQLVKEQQRAIRQKEKKLEELNKPSVFGFSRVQMGSIEARQLEAEIKKLKKLFTKSGGDFRKEIERVHKVGNLDFTHKMSLIYQKNYKNEMKKYSHLENYDKLKSKLDSFTSPESFYDFVKDKELLRDLTYQSDENLTQEEFNNWLLEDWEIEIEEKEQKEEIQQKEKYKYRLLDKTGKTIAQSDNKQTLENMRYNIKGFSYVEEN